MEYEIKGKWVDNGTEWVYEVKAVNKAGRILGKVNLFVDVETAIDMKTVMGEDSIKTMEDAAKNTLDTIVQERHKQ